MILAAILLSGSTQVWAAPAPVSDVANSANKFETRLAALENMMKTRNLLQVELQQQLESLQDEVDQLRGTTEEQGYTLEKMLQRQRELYQEIEDRVSQAYVKPIEPVKVIEAPISNDLTESDAYDRAVQLIMKDKRYDQAIPEFKTFLDKYPGSVYTPNAHYWLGQLLSMKSENVAAIMHFESVVQGYPDSNKRPDAMLKLGTAYQKQNKLVEAKNILEQLIAQYPDSTEAKLAQGRLDKF